MTDLEKLVAEFEESQLFKDMVSHPLNSEKYENGDYKWSRLHYAWLGWLQAHEASEMAKDAERFASWFGGRGDLLEIVAARMMSEELKIDNWRAAIDDAIQAIGGNDA